MKFSTLKTKNYNFYDVNVSNNCYTNRPKLEDIFLKILLRMQCEIALYSVRISTRLYQIINGCFRNAGEIKKNINFDTIVLEIAFEEIENIKICYRTIGTYHTCVMIGVLVPVEQLYTQKNKRHCKTAMASFGIQKEEKRKKRFCTL